MSINTDPPESVIRLGHMPQQEQIWQPADDWTGVIDRKQRRKLQNRQNQRAYRQRQKGPLSLETLIPESSAVMLVQSFDLPIRLPAPQTTTQQPQTHSKKEYDDYTDEYDDMKCHHAPDNALQLRRQLKAILQRAYIHGSPCLEHLLTLSRLNVHRAINQNIAAVGMTVDWMQDDDSVSIFNIAQPHSLPKSQPTTTIATPAPAPATQIPPSLQPTQIQLTIPHHPWLDFFPFPAMRDRLILAQEQIDDEELCHDLMAFWDTQNTQATLLVWGPPWDPRNWEVTEEFARKWGWLLLGSPEAMAASDFWRRRRGEKVIRWKEILNFEHE